MKAFRGYLLAAMPFLALFAYQILLVLPHRPEEIDVARRYIISVSLDDGGPTHYISALDCVMTFGPFACAVIIFGIGLWRGGAFRRKAAAGFKG